MEIAIGLGILLAALVYVYIRLNTTNHGLSEQEETFDSDDIKYELYPDTIDNTKGQ